jgi:hypothetical protein
MAVSNLVVVLNAADRALHVGARNDVTAHLEATPSNADTLNNDLEIFDSAGRRLLLQAANGGVELVEDAGTPADPQLVADRTALALAFVQVVLTRNPTANVGPRLPLVSAELSVMLAALAALFGPLRDPARPIGPPSQGDDYHNFCHMHNIAH